MAGSPAFSLSLGQPPSRGPSRTRRLPPPPPPCFDYRPATLHDTRRAVAASHPELMDLVDSGALSMIPKRRFGPVPSWRQEFVEPEEIWVLGTSHLSPESAADAERVVRVIKPDNVVVELCRSRAGIMYASSDPSQEGSLLNSNMFSLSGDKFLGAINRSINLGGQSALALRLLLALLSSKVSSGANQPFGDEFRAARRVAEEVGAQLVLGDRPIEITLERAWNSLRWQEKLRLISSLFSGLTSSVATPVEQAGLSPYQLYHQLSMFYPSLLRPLIHERDTYMAWSLKRSKAVNGSRTVVGVIGKGHLNGVVYALISDQGDLRFRDLVGGASSSGSDRMTSALASLVRDTVIGAVVWALYDKLVSQLS